MRLYIRGVMLSERVSVHRWRMLGHVLRSDENTAAHQALSFAVNTQDLPGRVGRPRCNLFNLLKSDLTERKLTSLPIVYTNKADRISHRIRIHYCPITRSGSYSMI